MDNKAYSERINVIKHSIEKHNLHLNTTTICVVYNLF